MHVEFHTASEESDTALYAALVFVVHRGQFLLTNIPGRGWSIPGGRSENGETARETAVREVYEETGAIVTPAALQHLGRYTLTPQSRPNAAPMLVRLYIARTLTIGAVPESSESLGTRLVPYEGLPQIYYFWDSLLEAVCRLAYERAQADGLLVDLV